MNGSFLQHHGEFEERSYPPVTRHVAAPGNTHRPTATTITSTSNAYACIS